MVDFAAVAVVAAAPVAAAIDSRRAVSNRRMVAQLFGSAAYSFHSSLSLSLSPSLPLSLFRFSCFSLYTGFLFVSLLWPQSGKSVQLPPVTALSSDLFLLLLLLPISLGHLRRHQPTSPFATGPNASCDTAHFRWPTIQSDR